ncbi:MAG: hypothetical protein WD472_03935 [Dehalococcoidia bacterium]
MADGLKPQYRREKARMDAMLYQPVNGCRAISVAIEHEHNAETAQNEAWRLSLLNSPLKVLVTYPEYGEGALLLNSYATVLEAVDTFRDFHKFRRQLVVFGFSEYSAKSIEWQYYLYSRAGFTRCEVTA